MPHEPQHVPLNPFETRILDTLRSHNIDIPPIRDVSGESGDREITTQDGEETTIRNLVSGMGGANIQDTLFISPNRTAKADTVPRFGFVDLPEDEEQGFVLAHEIGHQIDESSPATGSSKAERRRAQMLKRRAVMNRLDELDASEGLREKTQQVMNSPEATADMLGMSILDMTTGDDPLERSQERDNRFTAQVDTLRDAFQRFIEAKGSNQ